jgi:hypothetical protein
MIGLPVGFFILFAIAVFCFFRRHSQRQKQRINNQQLPPISQQTKLQKTDQQQPLISGGYGGASGAEVDGLAYKTELEAQNRPQQYQELNAQPWTALHHQGETVVEAGPRSPQEVHAELMRLQPQELPVAAQNGMYGRR